MFKCVSFMMFANVNFASETFLVLVAVAVTVAIVIVTIHSFEKNYDKKKRKYFIIRFL